MSILTPRTRENTAKSVVLVAAVLFFLSATVMAQEKAPERGFRPAGSYALSDIETISTTSGNMMLKVPLASLPPGRGDLSVSLNLIYNSKLYDAFPTSTYINHSYYDVTNLKKSQAGGWRYGYQYELYGEGRYGGTDPMGEINPCTFTLYIAKLSLLTPDGGKHELRLAGHTDGSGFQDIWQDGSPACPGGTGVTNTLSYYTTDGTFLRLDVEHDSDTNPLNNPWTLYLPDGGRVTGGASSQRIYDRNNNYVEIVNGTYNSHSATYFNDQVGRSVILEYESATNQDSIHVRGVANELLTTTVAWTNIDVHKAYTREVGTPFNLPATWRSVSQITLPSQAGSLFYSFGYNANGSNPTVGWGEISSITLPSGARSSYTYLQDNQNNISYNLVLQNQPSQKQLVYRPEYDVSSVSNTACNPSTETCITETSTYGMTYGTVDTYLDTAISSTITGPDGGVTTEYFNKNEDGTLNQAGLVYKSVAPDGTVTERYWQTNIPYGTPALGGTFYAKYEFTSITSGGALTQTAIKEYSYDKNGNVTRVAAYDWVPYANVPRNAQGRPYAPPAGVQPKAVTVNTYYNPTPDASDSTTYDADAFQMANSPRLHRTLESSEVQTSTGTALSRTEAFYDNTSAVGAVSYTIGNLTQQKSWDSTKGAISRPLGSGNIVSISNQYDSYGNPTLTTDAKGVQTQRVYGAVGGYTDLYPTDVKAAFGTSVQRYTTLAYDYYAGVATSSTDQDNGVTTTTSYDAFGRPTLVKNADGKTEETRTETVYSDINRRVIVRSDLNILGDGKLVTIQHYDQLGRVRLTRKLEDKATQLDTDETTGIKVQTRYIYSGANSYQLISNPYRAATSGGASSEVTMGWTRTKSDNAGRVLEVQTFAGASLPAPWGANATSTGTVTTAYDANFTTVTDQIGKVRRSKMNGLGQLERVDEPDVNNSLGTTDTPAQATSYTYDALGNLVTVNQGAQTRTFSYSSLSRLSFATNPESGTVSYLYDDNGNLTRKTDARPIYIDYAYDALNRNITVNYSDTAVNPDITRVYDNLTAGANGRGRFWYSYAGGNYSVGSNVEQTAVDSYDALGRPLVQRQLFKLNGTWGPTYQTQRSYNRAGGVTLQTYPSNRTVSYTYDNAGRTNAFAGNLGDGVGRTYATGIVYSPAGGMTNEQLGTDTPIYHKLQYNVRGQLWDVRVGTAPTGNGDWNRGALQFFYDQALSFGGSNPDNNGNVTATKHYRPLDEQSSTWTISTDLYNYDTLNRISSVTENYETNGQPPAQQFKQSYLYDRYGNRTIDPATWGVGINNKQFTVSTTNNRLGVPGGQAGTMTYDPAGNLTTDTYTGAGSRTYDAENRMKTAWGGNNQDQVYTYNADGQRVRRKVDNTETWQVYGMDGELLAEYPANGATATPQKEYGYRNGQLLITATAGSGSGGSPFVFTDDPLVAGGTIIRGLHLSELRDAVNQARARAGLAAASWTDSQPVGAIIRAVHITELRQRLDDARLALGLLAASYTDPGLSAGYTVKAVNVQELRARTNEALTAVIVGVVDIRWLVTDQLGTPRIIIDKTGSLAGVKRHDYLPFGEELFAGTGSRTAGQGYSGDGIRQKFTQKERDNETGLDYFSARYYSSVQGRFTSSDPGSFKIADPQNWDRYTYVQNNPLKFVDPTGKDLFLTGADADYIVAELQRASGLKLKRDAKTGQVTIDSSSKRTKKGTSTWLANKIGEITSDHDAKVRINTGRNQPGLAGDSFKKREIDVSDYDAFKKADKTFGIRLLAHVLDEYYHAEKMSGPDDAKFEESHEDAKEFEANVISDFTRWWEQPRQETLVRRTPTEIEVRFDYSTVSYDVLYKAGVGGDVTVAKVTKTEKQKPRRQ